MPQDASSLVEAVKIASPGDEIVVDSGFYEGQVSLDKQLIIRGVGLVTVSNRLSGGTLLLGEGSSGSQISNLSLEGTGSVLQVRSDTTPLTSLLLQHLQVRATGNSTAVVVDNAPGAVLNNITIQSDFGGIQCGGVAATPDLRLTNIAVRLNPLGKVQAGAFIKTSRLQISNLTVEPTNNARFLAGTAGLEFRGVLGSPEFNAANYVPMPGIVLEGLNVTMPGASFAVRTVNTPNFICRRSSLLAGALAEDEPSSGALLLETTPDFTATNVSLSALNVTGAGNSTGALCQFAGFFTGTTMANSTLRTGIVGFATLDAFDTASQPTGRGLHRNLRLENCALRGLTGSAAVLGFVENGSLVRCRVENSLNGVLVGISTGVLISNSLLLENRIAFGSLRGTNQARLVNNVLAYGGAVVNATPQDAFELRNNIIYRNQVVVLGEATGDFNDFFENQEGEVPLGDFDTNLNPQFADEELFVLSSGSRLIDRGDPAPTYNDQIPPGQGTVRNDMGAYGGPTAGNVGPRP